MKQFIQNLKKDLANNVFLMVEIAVVAVLTCLSFFFMPVRLAGDGITYFFVLLATFSLVGVAGCFFVKKTDEKRVIKRVMLCLALLCGFLVCVLLMDYESFDYLTYLKVWYESYEKSSVSQALYSIVDVSDYTPAYNYFLIFFAKTGLNALYSIKYLTLLFSILFAFIVEKIISHIKDEKFSIVRFSIILVLPVLLMEYSSWGQCDAIYTSFALLAFLFALKKKSKLSFMFIGLSFAFKMQFLFIVPVLFVMLIVKDEEGKHYLKWKDIWIAPLMYFVNLLPVFAGRPVLDVLLVFFRQTTTNYGLSAKCANLLYPVNVLLVDVLSCSAETLEIISKIFTVSFVILTLTVLAFILYVVLKFSKNHVFTKNDFVFIGMLFAFVMVFFMPKMLDRFYFISMGLSVVYFCVDKGCFSKIIPTLIQNALYFMMFLIYYNYIQGFLSAIVSVIGVASGVTACLLLLIEFKNRYMKTIKQD